MAGVHLSKQLCDVTNTHSNYLYIYTHREYISDLCLPARSPLSPPYVATRAVLVMIPTKGCPSVFSGFGSAIGSACVRLCSGYLALLWTARV